MLKYVAKKLRRQTRCHPNTDKSICCLLYTCMHPARTCHVGMLRLYLIKLSLYLASTASLHDGHTIVRKTPCARSRDEPAPHEPNETETEYPNEEQKRRKQILAISHNHLFLLRKA